MVDISDMQQKLPIRDGHSDGQTDIQKYKVIYRGTTLLKIYFEHLLTTIYMYYYG